MYLYPVKLQLLMSQAYRMIKNNTGPCGPVITVRSRFYDTKALCVRDSLRSEVIVMTNQSVQVDLTLCKGFRSLSNTSNG